MDKARILSIIRTSLVNLMQAVENGDAGRMCDSTRTLLTVGAILHAYHPGTWTRELASHTLEGFVRAYQRIDGHSREEMAFRGGSQGIYENNIRWRVETLRKAMPEWCPGWAGRGNADLFPS